MFQIGFLELVVVGIVALVVLGPERLPGAIRTASLWIGRLRRSFNTIKAEIEKEIGADEIRRQLRNEEIMEKFRHTQSQVQNSISAIKKETDEFKKNVELEAQVASLTGSAAAPASKASSSSGESQDAGNEQDRNNNTAAAPAIGSDSSSVSTTQTSTSADSPAEAPKS